MLATGGGVTRRARARPPSARRPGSSRARGTSTARARRARARARRAKTRSSRGRRATASATSGAGRKIRFAGLIVSAKPAASPATSAASRPPRVSARSAKYAATSSEHHRREVGRRDEPERGRERLVDELHVVALVEVRDRREREHDPRERREVREPAPADRLRDPVDAEERDRPEHEHVQRDDERQAGERLGPADQRERREQDRVAVADRRVRDVAVPEHPGARVVPGVVAAAVEAEAVVLRDRRDDPDDEPTGRRAGTPNTSPERQRHHPRGGAADGRQRRVPREREPRVERAAEGAALARQPACTPRRCSRYQAIVRARPSRSDVRARKPNSCLGLRRVERAPRLPVRHRRVPDDLALEPGQLGDRLGELADRDLDAGAEVDRLRRRRSARPRARTPRPRPRRRGTRASASRRPRARPRRGSRASCGRAPGSRARSRGRSCRAARRGSPGGGRPRRARTARGRPARRRAPTSSRRRTARSSPPGSRSRAPPRGTGPA